MRRLILFLSVLILITACDSRTIFKEYKKFDNVSWNRLDILKFEVPVSAGDELDFFLLLRHHTNFPYDKLYVNITFYSPSGDMRTAEYNFELKDEKGNWLAKGMGELWDIELPIRQNMHFSTDGFCKVLIENKYSKTQTPGIVEVGLLARKSTD